MPQPQPPRVTLLIDAGYVYAEARRRGASRPDYRALLDAVIAGISATSGRALERADLEIHLWTSAPVGAEARFQRFVEFLEKELGFQVYVSVGDESYLLDTRAFADDGDLIERLNARVQRHHVQIAYAIGLWSDRREFAVVTDGAVIVDILGTIGRKRGSPNYLVAFSDGLTKEVLNRVALPSAPVRFIDLGTDARVFSPSQETPHGRRRFPEARI